MKFKKNALLQRVPVLLDILLLAVPFKTAWVVYYAARSNGSDTLQTDILLLVLFILFYTRFSAVYEGFVISTSRISEVMLGQALAVIISDVLMFLVLWALEGSFPNVVPMLLVILAQAVIIFVWSVAVHKWYFATHPPLRALLVYAGGHSGIDSLQQEYGFQKRFSPVGIMSVEELTAVDFAPIDEAQSVFFESHGGDKQYELLKRCALQRKTLFILPETEEYILHGAKSIHMMHRSMLCVRKYDPSMGYLFVKRLMSLLFSSLALLILSPILLITAAAIKLGDGGPVFYRQLRLTQGGKPFYILKFRSMRVDAEKDGVARLSSGDKDDRITPVGRIIRKVHLDELPQLINILNGDMSIVGPRPERPELTEEYAAVFPDFKLRLQAKAGLTGYAQIYGKYNAPPKDKLIMDLAYIEHPSIWNDLEIMFATVKVLFSPEATEGIREGQTNALQKDIENK